MGPHINLASNIFRSLASNPRPWVLTRTLASENPSDLHCEIRGTATFRAKETTGADGISETVYAEEGEMPSAAGNMAGLRWSRKYIWRLAPLSELSFASKTEEGEAEGQDEALSVWFAKPTKTSPGVENTVEADYVFHDLEFVDGSSDAAGSKNVPIPAPALDAGIETEIVLARGRHLCINDDYQTWYSFRVRNESSAIEVLAWASRHVVQGPKKNQDIVNMYTPGGV
ncbi:hypothetical protein AJ80_03801 [Polytolypa hystricis UAMH7299]|uniref:DUF6314 domain-containing protein n=1 Tax=Polytolypa hystricis (strain UAMH7299) TaxID=1447883 RepID=A0A2B7YDN6_POLH7|nr:hypothetical protein AJ80_03801 [Polytolypa hystricis UAMH7299]